MLEHAEGEQVNLGSKWTKMMMAGVGGIILVIVAPFMISYITGTDIMSGKVNATDATPLIPPQLIHRTFGAGQLIGGIVAGIVLAVGGVKLELKKKLQRPSQLHP